MKSKFAGPKARLIFFSALLAFTVPACGYRMGSLMPENIKTISVQILNNATYWRGLEITLTREIHEEIASRTNLILSEKESADALLKGTIVGFRKLVLLEDIDDNTLESSVIAVVEVELVDLRTGKVLKKFTVRTDPNKSSFVETSEVVKTAVDESFADMAERIVYQMQEGF